jgi:DNA replication protein DnaC
MARKKSVIGCEVCYSDGYIVEKVGQNAKARVCDCVLQCTDCSSSGLILTKNEAGYVHTKACGTCGTVRRNVKLYNMAGMPAKFSHVLQVDAGFDPSNNESQQRALKYAKEEFVKKYPSKRGFLLMGHAGLGKTHLTIGTISELTLKYGVKCMFQDFFDLLTELKKAYSLGTPEIEVLNPLIDTEVLAIDELGKGKSSDWELNILDQLISKRYNASKTTLITTNFISSDYAKDRTFEDYEILDLRVGKRITSRLHEMCEFIHLKGDDRRRARRNV